MSLWPLLSLLAAASPGPSVAFYYAADPPTAALDLYDWVIVEPEHLSVAALADFHHAKVHAYVGAGEALPSRPWASKVQAGWRLGQNPAWKSWVMDLADPGWRGFLLAQVIEPLLAQGYGGVFLDALDSHQLVPLPPARRAAQRTGLLELIRSIKRLHPETSIILNRGFEVLPEARSLVAAVAVESLYRGWDQARKRYVEVPEQDRAWLLDQIKPVRALGLPVIALDYLPPQAGPAPADLARRLTGLDLIPWVADPELAHLGVGLLEVLPREVLLLWDGKRHQDVAFSEVHRLVAMPLEYLGMVPVYQDVHRALPKGGLRGRYAGIVAWIGAVPVADPEELRSFLRRAVDEQVPLVFLGGFPGELDDSFLATLGLERGARTPNVKVKILEHTPLLGFEAELRPRGRSFYPLRSKGLGFEVQLALGYQDQRMEAVGLAPWGGWAVEPHVIEEGADEDVRWILDPFRFLGRALRIEDRPVLDPTTENGRRLAFFHVDGDGMASKAEMPGTPYAGEVIRRLVVAHPWPHAISIVEGETSPTGLYPESSEALEGIARQLFALPQVEIASHGYLHPFRWREFEERRGTPGLHLEIPGAVPSVDREINGSVAYINRLAPPDKKLGLFLWTGDAMPGEATLAIARQAGLRNLNGGVTEVTRERSSMTRVWPMARPVGSELQIYAPVINENVYTALWTGPFYGFRRVIETFELTGAPRRIKPVDVYYHFYSGSKVAGLRALEEVYSWVERGPHFPIFPTSWVDRAVAFREATMARSLDGGWIFDRLGPNRSLRLPVSLAWPDLQQSAGIVGVSDDPVGRYLHSDGRGRIELRLSLSPPAEPYLLRANRPLLGAGPGEWSFFAAGPGPTELELAGPSAAQCRLEAGGRRLRPTMQGKVASFRLQESESGRARLICR